jgi:hypothetical protein
MLKKLFVASIILMAAISISCADSGPNMKEGLWEITTKMHMQGMEMPPVKHTQCITKNDLVPQGSQQPGQECEITKIKTSGNSVTWTMKCTGQGGEVIGTGEITYSGESFKGTMTISMPQANMEMTSHLSGKRIGKCK